MTIAKKIADRLEKGAWVRRMFEEGAELKAKLGPDKVFDFTIGNPAEGPPREFHQALKKLVAESPPGMHGYMPNGGHPSVREKVAASISAECGLKVEAEQVVMTAGAGGALNVALHCLLDPGDEVILLSPYFLEYPIYVDNHGGRPVIVPTGPGFVLDLEAIEAGLTERTKAIILNSPNNPSGVVYPKDQLQALGDLLRHRQNKTGQEIYLLCDEPYKKHLYDGARFPHVFPLVDNALIATSHSKDLCLGGERIGYLAASPGCARVDLLAGAMVFANRTLGFVNAPSMMQLLVADLQDVPVDTASYEKRRDGLYLPLTRLGFEAARPQGGFYLFPKSPIPDDVDFVNAARKHNILIAPGRGFGAPGYFRVVFSVDLGAIERSIPAWEALAREFGMIG